MDRKNEIVEINISRESRGVTRQGFGKPLFIGTTGFSDNSRVRRYTEISQVEDDFVDGDVELDAARRFFGQELRPSEIKIGYHDPQKIASVEYDVTSPTTGSLDYEFTINGEAVTHTASEGDAVRDVIEALEIEFANTVTTATFSKSESSFRVSPVDPDTFDYSVATDDTLTENEVKESYVNAYNYIKSVDTDFYYTTMESHEKVDVEGMADVVQAEKRIFVTSTSDPKSSNSLVTDDIGTILKNKDLTRTFIIFAEDDKEYPECALVGLQASKSPGTSTWKFRTVSGITASNLSVTQSLSLKGTRYEYGKGYNTYEDIGGRKIFSEGRAVNGEFLDQKVAC